MTSGRLGAPGAAPCIWCMTSSREAGAGQLPQIHHSPGLCSSLMTQTWGFTFALKWLIPILTTCNSSTCKEGRSVQGHLHLHNVKPAWNT